MNTERRGQGGPVAGPSRSSWSATSLVVVGALYLALFQPSFAGEPPDRVAIETSTVVVTAPSSSQGFIGGESHATYAYDAHEGENLSIRISWRVENGNTAEFMVSESNDMGDGKPLGCAHGSTDGRRWTCTVAKDGRLYIHVVAYPSAHFKLTLRSDRKALRGKR